MNTENYERFKEATIRAEYGHRGGGIEIDLSFFGFPGEQMTAYQNYLGGGLLGKVQSDCTIDHYNHSYNEEQLTEVSKLQEQLKEYFFNLTNPKPEYPDGEKCWEHQTYAQNQGMNASAY